jgi:predicted nuclease of predicted toxin-antitoxin system
VKPARFLIDENLSPRLADVARDFGFEATHVNYLGLRSETDWELLKVVAADDWVLVTNNALEFRGRYREIDLHPGVIFLVPVIRRPQQIRLFEAALHYVRQYPDLTNRGLDIDFGSSGESVVTAYDLP